MLTNENLVSESIHQLGGLQRIYKFGERFGLSLVNSEMCHCYEFAWEAAVLIDGKISCIPLGDVVVFSNDDEANDFILKAKAYFESAEAKLIP